MRSHSLGGLDYVLQHTLAYAGCDDTPCPALDFHVGTKAKRSTGVLWSCEIILRVAYAGVHNRADPLTHAVWHWKMLYLLVFEKLYA